MRLAYAVIFCLVCPVLSLAADIDNSARAAELIRNNNGQELKAFLQKLDVDQSLAALRHDDAWLQKNLGPEEFADGRSAWNVYFDLLLGSIFRKDRREFDKLFDKFLLLAADKNEPCRLRAAILPMLYTQAPKELDRELTKTQTDRITLACLAILFDGDESEQLRIAACRIANDALWLRARKAADKLNSQGFDGKGTPTRDASMSELASVRSEVEAFMKRLEAIADDSSEPFPLRRHANEQILILRRLSIFPDDAKASDAEYFKKYVRQNFEKFHDPEAGDATFLLASVINLTYWPASSGETARCDLAQGDTLDDAGVLSRQPGVKGVNDLEVHAEFDADKRVWLVTFKSGDDNGGVFPVDLSDKKAASSMEAPSDKYLPEYVASYNLADKKVCESLFFLRSRAPFIYSTLHVQISFETSFF